MRRDLHALAERVVARIEGALLTGPWRPTNGSPSGSPASLTPRRQSRMVTSMSAEAIAIAGVGVALLAPLLVSIRRDVRDLRAETGAKERKHG